MLLSWMAYATLIGALVYGAAAAANRMVATWGRSRRVVWAAALVVAVAGPATFALLPASRAPTAAEVSAPQSKWSVVQLAGRSTAPSETLRAQMSQALAIANDYAGRAWLTASLVWLALLLRAAIAIRRQRVRWADVEVDGVHVFVAPSLGPAVIGVLTPRVVLPQWALSLDDSARRLMLRHETEHIRARDPLLVTSALLASAAFPWNAALWMIVRRLRLAVEIDCDRRVLRSCAHRREYGELLLTVGARRGASLPFATSLAERRTSLERRITAMTPIASRHPRLMSAASVTLVIVATTAAVRAPRPASLVQPRQHDTAARGLEHPDSLSAAELRGLIAAHHPKALVANAEVNTITLVIDADGNYVAGMTESRAVDGGGRGGRSGNPGGPTGAGVGRARGNGSVTPEHADVRPRLVQRTQMAEWNAALGISQVKTRVISLAPVAGDTMRLTTSTLIDEKPDSARVFTVINSNMRWGQVVGLNTTSLSQIVDLERVETIHTRTFEAGDLGATQLNVFVARLKAARSGSTDDAAQSQARITFEYEQAPLSRVVGDFAAFSGRTIVLAANAGDPNVTAAMQNVGWRRALDDIVSHHGLVAEPDGASTIRVSRR